MDFYVKRIITLLQAGIESERVKHYLVGKPQNISEEVAEGNFIIVNPTNSSTNVADTQRDTIEGDIEILVGVQVRLDYNGTDYEQGHMLRALDIMEGTHEDGTLKADTVKYILRAKINDTWLHQESFEIDYENQRDEAYIYAVKLLIKVYGQRNRNNN